MDIVYFFKQILVWALRTVILAPPILLFAFDLNKWLAGLFGLLWLPLLIVIFFSTMWFQGWLLPHGNRQARHLLARAEAGDVDAQYRLAKAADEGRLGLGASDKIKPLDWYKRAADQAHGKAALWLADRLIVYDECQGAESSVNTIDPVDIYRPILTIDVAMRQRQMAAIYYKQAAVAGDLQAMGRLGNLYLLGNAVRRDRFKAHMWLSRAINSARNLSDDDSHSWPERHNDISYWTEWRNEAESQMNKAEICKARDRNQMAGV